jgi:hypothetical protein
MAEDADDDVARYFAGLDAANVLADGVLASPSSMPQNQEQEQQQAGPSSELQPAGPSSERTVEDPGGSQPQGSSRMTFEQLCRLRKDGGLIENGNPKGKKREKTSQDKKEIWRQIAMALYLAQNSKFIDGRRQTGSSLSVEQTYDKFNQQLNIQSGNCTGKSKIYVSLSEEIHKNEEMLKVPIPGVRLALSALPVRSPSFASQLTRSVTPACVAPPRIASTSRRL